MMNDLFGGNLFDAFGDDFDFELPTAPAATKSTPKKEEKKKTTTKKATKKPEKKVEITLPVTVIGGTFKTTLMPAVGESEVVDGAEALKRLQAAGFEEVVTSARELFVPEESKDTIFIVSKTAVSSSLDTLIDFGEKGVTFAYGEKKIVYTAADFEGVEADELSLALLGNKALESFPEFKGCDLVYDVEAGVVMPLFKNSDNISGDKKKTINLPATFELNGESILLTEAEISDNKATEIANYLKKNFEVPNLSVNIFKTQTEDLYMVSLTSYKSSSVDTSALKKNKGAKTEKKQEKYPSNCTVWLGFNGYSETLSAEKMGGKEKFIKQDLIDYFKEKFKVFSVAEKVSGLECFYDDIQNRLTVAIQPGRRGAYAPSSLAEDVEDSPSKNRRPNRSWDFDEDHEWYANTPDHKAPDLDMIYSNYELERYMNAIGQSCLNKRVFPNYALSYKGKDYMDTSIYANAAMAFVSKEDMESLYDFNLKIPKAPRSVLEGIVSYFRKNLPNEAIIKINYDFSTKLYSLEFPKSFKATATAVWDADFAVNTNPYKITVATVHSHNVMSAFFSGTDDEAEMDEIGLFGVVGKLNTDTPQFLFRAVKEGKSLPVSINTIFEEEK